MKLLEMMLQMLPQKWFGSKQVRCCNDQVEILIILAFAARGNCLEVTIRSSDIMTRSEC